MYRTVNRNYRVCSMKILVLPKYTVFRYFSPLWLVNFQVERLFFAAFSPHYICNYMLALSDSDAVRLAVHGASGI